MKLEKDERKTFKFIVVGKCQLKLKLDRICGLPMKLTIFKIILNDFMKCQLNFP